MRHFKYPENFTPSLPIGITMSYPEAMFALAGNVAFPEVMDRIYGLIEQTGAAFKKKDLLGQAAAFSNNPDAVVNMNARLTVKDRNLELHLEYYTGTGPDNPAVRMQMEFGYYGNDFKIITPHKTQIWYESDGKRTVEIGLIDVIGESLLWTLEANPVWALENLEPQQVYGLVYHRKHNEDVKNKEIRITIEGAPAVGKTVLLARIARMIQKEIGLVGVTIEGVDDNPEAFQEKANLSDEAVRDILLRTDGVRLTERYSQIKVASGLPAFLSSFSTAQDIQEALAYYREKEKEKK